jgi:hypothetical protein
MRHSDGARNLRLSVLHPTRQSAEEEAQRLFVQMMSDPDKPTLCGFYVMEIVGRVGVFNGKFEG